MSMVNSSEPQPPAALKYASSGVAASRAGRHFAVWLGGPAGPKERCRSWPAGRHSIL